jgi:hypothetical protein
MKLSAKYIFVNSFHIMIYLVLTSPYNPVSNRFRLLSLRTFGEKIKQLSGSDKSNFPFLRVFSTTKVAGQV